jgi:phage shock protein PspC (stress-responsive transcriptional regulator)
MKKLVRSKECMIAGVCGGFAQYLGMDPTIIRLLWAVISLVTGVFLGLIIYIACAIIIPKDDDIIG